MTLGFGITLRREMNKYTVLGSPSCAPCRSIKENLKPNVTYVDPSTDPDLVQELLAISKVRSVPQLFLGKTYVSSTLQTIKGVVCK